VKSNKFNWVDFETFFLLHEAAFFFQCTKNWIFLGLSYIKGIADFCFRNSVSCIESWNNIELCLFKFDAEESLLVFIFLN